MENRTRERKVFVCKHCGANIDIRRKREDGSLQCPQCKVVYRPRPAQGQRAQVSQSTARRQPQRKRRSGFAELWHAIPWQRKVFKLPVWLWAVIVLLSFVFAIPSSDENAIDNVVENETPVVTSEPTQQPDIEETSETKEDVTGGVPKLEFGELLNVTETPNYLFDEYDNLVGKEDNIVVIKAKIAPSYNNKATIKQNYLNIEDLIKNQGFDKFNELQYWAVADMTDGSESKVFSCTVSKGLINSIKEGNISVERYEAMVNDLWILPSLLQ